MTAGARKALKALAIMLLLLVICVLFAISFLSLESTRNIPLNDSDLIFTRPQISVESNAYYTLLKATNELYWPAKLDNKLKDLSDNTNWDDSLAADVLEKNRACLDSFDEAMQKPYLLVPEIKKFDDNVSYLGGWDRLASLKSIQIFSLHRAKKDEQAFGQAFETIKLGQRAENSGGSVIHYLTGSGIKSRGLWTIRQMLPQTTLSDTDLVRSIRSLGDFRPNLEGLTNALKVEYEIQRNLVDDYAAGNIPDTTNTDFERAMTSAGMKAFLNAKKTKMEFAQAGRFMFSNSSKPFGEIPWSRRPNMDIETNDSIIELLASGNAMGDGLYKMVGWSLDGLAKAKSRDDVKVTATQLLLALKIYKMRHGKLPDSISELVPEFFPAVPMDDFDGHPFRYLPEKRIIYSVGPGLKDLGGIERTNYSADYNLPFKIEF